MSPYNEQSFWLEQRSLLNLLDHVGFSSTLQLFTPKGTNIDEGDPG